MAYAMTKQGSLDNCVTYEFICDAVEDMNAIEDRYRTIGTVAIVLSGASGLEVYIAGSDKQWNSLSSIGGSAASDTAGLSIYICAQNEVSEGVPDVELPDEQTLYLVPAAEPDSGNLYDEYIYVEDEWEKFGSGGSTIDLSNYVTYQDLDNADYATHNDLNDYASLDNNGKVSIEQLPLPTISSDDNGKILKVKSGDWSVENEIDISGKIDKKYEVNFESKTWNGLTNFNGNCIWTDGDNIYYSYGSQQYVLDKSTGTWSHKTWNGALTSFYGDGIWFDETHIYYSYGTQHYELVSKEGSYWNYKAWYGMSQFYEAAIWTDGDNIYSSSGSDQRVLNKANSTWNTKTWNGNYRPSSGEGIWTDGENIYCDNNGSHLILDKATSTWSINTWNGFTDVDGRYIWTDGNNFYFSDGSRQYVLDQSTSTWSPKTWNGLSSFSGQKIWTDGENYYFSNGSTQRVLDNKPKVLLGQNGEFSSITMKNFAQMLMNEIPAWEGGSY